MKKMYYRPGSLFLALLFTFITMNAQDKVILDPQQQALVKISALTAAGNIPALRMQLDSALQNAVTVNEIKEALVQLYAYCGFPRSLNAINTFKTVLEERKAKGITDPEGKPIIGDNNPADKYEQGRKTLELLTGTAQPKPAPGFGTFAPRIDAFLKEHLFADIFASEVLSHQQRELVTIAALASMTGVESQLQSHINIGKNIGITTNQLEALADLISKYISTEQGNTVRKIIGKPVEPSVTPGMMIRIAEIEIVPEFLQAYKTILQANVLASMEKEPGVISIFPMYRQQTPTLFRIVEIYATKDAYESHLKTYHFQDYKTSTFKMVKSLKLIEMEAVNKETMPLIFEKL
ncbi:MAG: carboxymuconolactone decarboxylase family protein [Ferruginibacter sp.]